MAKHGTREIVDRKPGYRNDSAGGIRFLIFVASMLTFFALYWLAQCTALSTFFGIVLLAFAILAAMGAYAATFVEE